MMKNTNNTGASMTYQFVYPTGETAPLTSEQYTAMVKVADRWEMTPTVEVLPMFGGNGAIVVNVGSMWLAVEPDGYTHS
jgi:hypothetical protein